VLILSELAGAADELQEAIRINPNDTDAICQAIEEAFLMPPDEQQHRMAVMQKRIAHYTISRWTHDFLDQLNLARQVQNRRHASVLTTATVKRVTVAYKQAKRRLLLLDYDGTLKTFVNSPKPELAAPPQELRNLLVSLVAATNIRVVIISGRSRNALNTWFKDLPLTLVSEHGAWIRQDMTWRRGVAVSGDFKTMLKPLLDHYAERTAGALVEEKELSLVWHYRNVPPELAYARNMSLLFELGEALAGTDVGVFEGNKIIEIKPYALQKGAVLQRFITDSSPDFILCAGDDYTDEDMFAALPSQAFSIKVGYGPTGARLQVASVPQFLELLSHLI
jgi:trehalose 6-phosphate synthase/phosphatase